MASSVITLSDDSLVGEFVAIDDFRGVVEQRHAIGPDLVAILIRDGQIVQASAGANIAVGGFWRGIKDAIFGEHTLRLLIADLKPFSVTAAFEAVTRDDVPAAGELTIELQINPERPANVLGLMRNADTLAKSEILSRLGHHLGDRVLASAVRSVDAQDLRGNKALQDKVQADVLTEIERVAGDLGLIVRAASLQWTLNAEEIAAIHKRAAEREEARLDIEARMVDRAVEREGASTLLKLETARDIEKLKTASDGELQRMIVDHELALVDARATAQRVEAMKTLQNRLDGINLERRNRLQAEIEAAEHQVALAERQAALAKQQGVVQGEGLANDEALRRYQILVARLRAEQREIERGIEEADHRQGLALRRLEQMQELEIADKAHEQQMRTMAGLQNLRHDDAAAMLDLDLRGREAEHRRRLEEQRQEAETALAKMGLMKDMSPDLALAINAGVSKDVATVLVEQARAKAGDGAEKMALMREMIEQAREGRVATEAQARHFFEQAMQGAAGVAQGVGGAAPPRHAGAPAPAEVECPNCHRPVPAANRFCSACGHQMRT